MDHDALIERLTAARRCNILLVGDFTLDRYVVGDAERISPESPVPVLRVVDQHHQVGGAGGIATALAALECHVICCGLIGQDAGGSQLNQMLVDLGCRTDGLIGVPDRPTSTNTRLVGLAQHRHRQQLMRVDTVPGGHVAPDVVERLVAVIAQASQEVDVICLAGYGQGTLAEPVIRRAIETAGQRSIPVLVDPSICSSYEPYRGATLLVANRNEFATVTGEAPDDIESLGRSAQALAGRCDLSGIVVTLDRDGALLARADEPPRHISTRERAIYDNTGAGEQVLATLSAMIGAGVGWQQAVALANVAGGLEVEHFGFVAISRDEILSDLLAQQHRPAAKLRTAEQMLVEVRALRRQGKRIVFTNGCYDVLHPGHLATFEFCRQQGDVVVVGLDSDQSVQCNNKGEDRPIFKEVYRAQMIGGLQAIDFVVLFDDTDPTGLIRSLQPDVLVKGGDCATRGVVGREIVEGYGGQVTLAPMVGGHSTTAILKRIREISPQ